jgi:hypothetical protein
METYKIRYLRMLQAQTRDGHDTTPEQAAGNVTVAANSQADRPASPVDFGGQY